MEEDAHKRREKFASKSTRSVSAPSRKKWYKRMPASMRRMGSQQNLCDQNFNHVSRRLVGAIATWHDIHANLLRLSIGRGEQSTSGEEEDELSSRSEYFSCCSTSSTGTSHSSHGENNVEEADGSFRDGELGKFHSRLSLSNPELTNLQLKAMFPDVSDHWSYHVYLLICLSTGENNVEEADGSFRDGELGKFHSRLSLSNPELTNLQLKAMFPDVSDHWRPLFIEDDVSSGNMNKNGTNGSNVFCVQVTLASVSTVSCNGNGDRDGDSDYSGLPLPSASVPPCTKLSAVETRDRSTEKNAERCAQKLAREQSFSHSPDSKRVGGAVHHSSAWPSRHRRKPLSNSSSSAVSDEGTNVTSKESPSPRSPSSPRSTEEERTLGAVIAAKSMLRKTSTNVFRRKKTLDDNSQPPPAMRKSLEGMKVICFTHKGKPPSSVQKKPLVASLSWDPKHRSRSPSLGSRSRSHSVCSEQSDPSDADETDRLALESSCLHCSISARNRRRRLRGKIESAVERLRRNLGECKPASWSRSMDEQQQKGVLEAPDIVVSSVSSEDDLDSSLRNTASEMESLPTSATRGRCESKP
ncbi:Putative diacylglycerol kinase K06A1.6 [Toxocara canis]|uniref:Putative diacylglycerol kinase K06A1.6 n=1 Tax=Toxocara canis TaxID=6265 RepID=A0A0B2W114_TOXCA|nr:Putative diacylglycerol kinase K06A1.6 [Toxocara canis]